MARPNQSEQRKRELIPVLACAFAELGYRRATTAALAERCGLRENQLYRLWPNKKAMFLAAIEYLYEYSAERWQAILNADDGRPALERVLDWEGEHRGETGLHRITFAGLSETDDPEVREALREMYRKFHAFIIERVREHRSRHDAGRADDALTAWGIIGLGMMTNIGHELGLYSPDEQKRVVHDVGMQLLDG